MAGSRALSEIEEAAVLGVLDRFASRDRLLVTLGLNTGFRLAELLALRVGHVWDGERIRSTLRLERRHMKLGRGVRRREVSSRAVPINDQVRAALADHLEVLRAQGCLEPQVMLFRSGQREEGISRMQATRVLARIFRAAEIVDCGGLSSHSLRKRFAMRLMALSGNNIEVVRAALGHRSVATTQVYVAVSEREAMDLVVQMGRAAVISEPADYLGDARDTATGCREAL